MTVWAAFALSRFLRFLLEEDIYYHWHLARGIPQAISTMVHYAFLLIGFFVGLAVLGVDLIKVTILAGAFTVGVGFGLQTVNVVSLVSAAVSFNLRAWTDQYEDWIQVRSDLAVAIDEALIRENIAVA